MPASRVVPCLVTVIAAAVLVAACSGTASPAPPGEARTTVVTTRGVAFEAENPLSGAGVLDVFAPSEPGPWPVVVMFGGDRGSGETARLTLWASRVAELGFVVFVPTWGQSGGAAYDALPLHDQLVADAAQSACAVEFARATAAAYGGDPASLILFGHSQGANVASAIAFNLPAPTGGCLGGVDPRPVSALVTYDGDWLLSSQPPAAVDADPRLLDVLTPWTGLAAHPDLPVVMLSSAERLEGRAVSGISRAVLEPTGLGDELEASGATADGFLDNYEAQELLCWALEAQGNLVTLTMLPGSTHEDPGATGWPVLLDAFRVAVDLG